MGPWTALEVPKIITNSARYTSTTAYLPDTPSDYSEGLLPRLSLALETMAKLPQFVFCIPVRMVLVVEENSRSDGVDTPNY